MFDHMQRRRRLPRGGAVVWALGAIAMIGGLASWAALRPQRGIPAALAALERVPARRTDLFVSVRASGRVESAKKTLIECELENLSAGTRGRFLTTNGASTVIDIIPSGTQVKAGDVLCELDASQYEELVRQQEIKVQEERAQAKAATLALEIAETNLREFNEGLQKQTIQQYQGQLALAQANVESQKARLAWTERMAELGYLPGTRISAERQSMDRAEIAVAQTLLAKNTFERFGVPRTVRTLEARIESARSAQTYQNMSLSRNEERLALLKRQVERCTIRAPHDGFAVYANDDDDDEVIEVGMQVRQKQDLFFLPDLSNMVVETDLNETVVEKVRPGMQARIRVEAMPQVAIEGHVTKVSSLPNSQRSWRQSADVKNYGGIVKLDFVPIGLFPGMTAEVEVLTDRREGVIVVPPSAVTVQDGRDYYCIVARPEGPTRRSIAVGAVTPEAVEIVTGLDEGEEVYLTPQHIDVAHVIDDEGPPHDPEAPPSLGPDWSEPVPTE